MVVDIIISAAGPATGGIIAAIAGLWVARHDRKKAREEEKKRWYMSLFRLSQELNTSIRTTGFMELGKDKQRLIQQFQLIAEQLDKERYRAPLDADSGLISALANTGMYAQRLEFDVIDLRQQQYHYKMLKFAEEIQYYVQKELGDDLPVTYEQDKMSDIEERISTRNEMSRDEWRHEDMKRLSDELNEQHTDLVKKLEGSHGGKPKNEGREDDLDGEEDYER